MVVIDDYFKYINKRPLRTSEQEEMEKCALSKKIKKLRKEGDNLKFIMQQYKL